MQKPLRHGQCQHDEQRKLIDAAEKVISERNSGNDRKRGNPFGKAWGLQTDGDLWKQAWLAVLKRGTGNQSLRKVKGHATEKDIENSISNPDDKEGNDVSDKLADKGVEAITGIGLAKNQEAHEQGAQDDSRGHHG